MVKYRTGKIDFSRLREKFMRLEAKTAMETLEFNRQMAVRALNVILKWTPPNLGAAASDRPGQEGVKALKKRIENDIWNKEDPLSATPQKRRNGSIGIGRRYGKKGKGGFPFVIYKAPQKARVRPQFANVLDILKNKSKWKVESNATRLKFTGSPDDVFWVRRSDITKAVRERQAHAGELISGWYPAAAFLRLTTLSNFSPKGHSKRGSVMMQHAAPVTPGLPAADWALSVSNQVKTSPHAARWVQGRIATSLSRRIAMAQTGLFFTRLSALARQIKFAA